MAGTLVALRVFRWGGNSLPPVVLVCVMVTDYPCRPFSRRLFSVFDGALDGKGRGKRDTEVWCWGCHGWKA